MTRIALFASHAPGLEVAKFLYEYPSEDHVVALYLTGEEPEVENEIVAMAERFSTEIFWGREPLKDRKHLNWFESQQIDAVICVYWPWLLQKQMFVKPIITVNFHPALLPVNRGWYPHVHSLVDGSETGVTLHEISENADEGAIWVQRPVPIQATDTAKEIYDRLQREITDLFIENWEIIKNGQTEAVPQDETRMTYHSKAEVSLLDEIALDRAYLGRDFLNRLRARSFGDQGFAFFVDENGEKIYLNLRLSRTSKF